MNEGISSLSIPFSPSLSFRGNIAFFNSLSHSGASNINTASTVVGTGLSFYQTVSAIYRGDEIGAFTSAADTLANATGFLGPFGIAFSAGYGIGVLADKLTGNKTTNMLAQIGNRVNKAVRSLGGSATTANIAGVAATGATPFAAAVLIGAIPFLVPSLVVGGGIALLQRDNP